MFNFFDPPPPPVVAASVVVNAAVVVDAVVAATVVVLPIVVAMKVDTVAAKGTHHFLGTLEQSFVPSDVVDVTAVVVLNDAVEAPAVVVIAKFSLLKAS